MELIIYFVGIFVLGFAVGAASIVLLLFPD